MTILDRPPPDWKRPGTPPLSVQVPVLVKALRAALGVPPDTKFQFEHRPAIWERKFDTVTRDTVPPAQDPAHIFALTDAQHDIATHGRGGEKRISTYGSDSGNRRKLRDLTADQAEFVRALLHKRPGRRRPRKNTIASRPFPKRAKKGKRA